MGGEEGDKKEFISKVFFWINGFPFKIKAPSICGYQNYINL